MQSRDPEYKVLLMEKQMDTLMYDYQLATDATQEHTELKGAQELIALWTSGTTFIFYEPLWLHSLASYFR